MPTDQINKALGPSPGPGCSPPQRQLQKSIDWTRHGDAARLDGPSLTAPVPGAVIPEPGRLDRVGPGVTQ